VADAWDLLRTTGAMLIATFEIVSYAQEVLGIENAHPMHIGGGHDFPFGRVKLTPAVHGGMVAGAGAAPYTTVPAGVLLTLNDVNLYHAGDTGLTKDFELLEGQVDIALLPIGDNFTMGPEDAVRAVDMIRPRVVVPMHYDTWPVIEQDAQEFKKMVEPRAEVVVMTAGAELDF
jgi:L-ascorbate metabolism protein UlaG (beta-lactamase superfamily)